MSKGASPLKESWQLLQSCQSCLELSSDSEFSTTQFVNSCYIHLCLLERHGRLVAQSDNAPTSHAHICSEMVDHRQWSSGSEFIPSASMHRRFIRVRQVQVCTNTTAKDKRQNRNSLFEYFMLYLIKLLTEGAPAPYMCVRQISNIFFAFFVVSCQISLL